MKHKPERCSAEQHERAVKTVLDHLHEYNSCICLSFSCPSVVSMPIQLKQPPRNTHGYLPRSIVEAQKDE
ncbi:hypothetical protein CH286_18280 [Rhodococcus sp. WWJCD1]|nr:hypothetical protein CH286_18280 [Rhodococcus sp. WWJCD1]